MLAFLRAVMPLAALSFPIHYMIRSRHWWRYVEGWYLLGSHVAFAALLGLGTLSVLLGPRWQAWPGRHYVIWLAYVVLFAVFLAPHALLVIARRSKDKG